MKRKIVLLAFVLVLLLSAVPVGDSAQWTMPGFGVESGVDWWPMFRHDLSRTGYSTSTAPNTNNTIWNYTTGDWVSSPVVADGKVYVGSGDNKVYCLNASTGVHIWNYTTGLDAGSSPAVADGKVYVGSYDHKVYCLDAATGAHVWNYTTGDWVSSSPAVVNGKVYVGSLDFKVYCLNASTGIHVWNYTTGYHVWSSPTVVDGKVYVGSADNRVYCLNASTGAHVWNYTTGFHVVSSLAVVDGKVYVGSYDHKVYCLNASTGTHVWNYTTGLEVNSCPAVADGKVYVGSYDHKVYCLNATTGAHIWNYTTGSEVNSSPAVADGKVYVGSDDNRTYCLNASTGAKIWSYTTGGYVFSSPAVADGKVYVGSADGKVYAFGPPPPDTIPPVITFLSPENITYATSSIPLTFTVSESTSWVGYSLDGQANVTIAGNTTLFDLSEGTRNMVIYANDTAGNMGSSNTVYFTIDVTPPNIETPTRLPTGDVMPDQPVKVSVNITDMESDIKNVTLSYTTNNGTSWTNLTMNLNSTTGLYETTIPGQPLEGTWVKYVIIVYDNAGNRAVNDNEGEYHIYLVIPEFPSMIILPLFMIATLLTVIVYRRKHLI